MTNGCIGDRAKWACGICLALVVLGFVTPLAQAQNPITQEAVDRAHNFLKTAKRGKSITAFVHFGAKYTSHTYKQIDTVKNRPGHFVLVYDFVWQPGGETTLAFFCDPKGNVYAVQVDKSNGVLQAPYAVANLTIQVVGNLVLDQFRNQMTNMEIQQAEQSINNPNARGLLELNLKLEQVFGQ